MALIGLSGKGLLSMAEVVLNENIKVDERDNIISDILKDETPKEGDRVQIIVNEEDSTDKTYIGRIGTVEKHVSFLGKDIYGITLDSGEKFMCSRIEISKIS